MSNIETEDKNNSSYSELYNEVMKTSRTIKDLIPKMCQAFRKENPKKNDEELNNRIKRDMVAAGYNLDYVTHCIPEKYKNYIKMLAGTKGASQTNIILGRGGGNEPDPLPIQGAETSRQTIESPDFIKMGRRVEELSSRVHELEEQLDLKNEMLRTTDGSDVKELQEKLESAEMEIGFLKEAKNGEELIRIKGNKGKNEFYYCDRVGIVLLKREISKLESRGIKTFQIYLQAII